jgi:hypothetical protein
MLIATCGRNTITDRSGQLPRQLASHSIKHHLLIGCYRPQMERDWLSLRLEKPLYVVGDSEYQCFDAM